MRAYSIDLRERVVKAVVNGLSRREAARRLDVGAATAVRWARQWETTGSLAAAIGKPGRSPLEAHADFLLDLWAKQPDITLEELQAELAAGLAVTTGLSSIHRFFARRDITFKKNAVRRRTGQS